MSDEGEQTVFLSPDEKKILNIEKARNNKRIHEGREWQVFFLSDKEAELMTMLVKWRTLQDAAKEIGVSKAAASMRLRRVRMRYQKAKEVIEEVDQFRKKLPSRYL